MKKVEPNFWALRKCFILPPKEAHIAANLLYNAVDACNSGDIKAAKKNIIEADFQILEDWRYKISGKPNQETHRIKALSLTFDHVIPHSRGGTNDFENMVVSCQTCNCGKGNSMLEELGLIDPRTHLYSKSTWNGLIHLKY